MAISPSSPFREQNPVALPPGFMPFEEFEQRFALGDGSTEKSHPVTERLSQTMCRSVTEGMALLLAVDEGVVAGLEAFIPSIDVYGPLIAEKVSRKGRVFLVGSGSSGRVAIDIAAKCEVKFPETKERVQGIIAGGDSAMIRAKEGFEDSEADGEAVLKDADVGSEDTVILISASGSAPFNVGCARFSSSRGAHVFYFYNSQTIPKRTQDLFNRSTNPVVPLCLDIGPQAIGGSTRLQGATLAEACLGALLGSILYRTQGKVLLAEKYPKELASKMRRGLGLIRDRLGLIQSFSLLERDVFSSPSANFRRVRDASDQGYVTFVASESSIREVLIDSTETSPTFSVHPIRRKDEGRKRRPEFRAYLAGRSSNTEAWAALLGRGIRPTDSEDAGAFLLAVEETGNDSFPSRPLGAGNVVFGVAKVGESEAIPSGLIEVLRTAKERGGSVGLLAVCKGSAPKDQIKELEGMCGRYIIVLEETPSDDVGFAESIILKQILNLISNSSMILMNKVHGNRMIDVRTSNGKLIDRCIRLIKGIWAEYRPNQSLNDRMLYHHVACVSAVKKSCEDEGVYMPSVVKVVLTMLALKKTLSDLQEAVRFLTERQERVDWIEDPFGRECH